MSKFIFLSAKLRVLTLFGSRFSQSLNAKSFLTNKEKMGNGNLFLFCIDIWKVCSKVKIQEPDKQKLINNFDAQKYNKFFFLLFLRNSARHFSIL